jgi:HAD superfamily hydrolase (TIGR01509 family)
VFAVIFDFDGVLVDTERLHLRAIQHAFAPKGWTLTEGDYFDRYLGYDDRGLVAAFARDCGIAVTAADAASVLAHKEREYAAIVIAGDVLFPGARACVERLAGVFPLAIASGSLRGEIEHILQANDLRRCFRAIVGADDVTAGKPAPDSYLRAAASLGVRPTLALAIEDSPMGLQSARQAGLITVGITTSYGHDALSHADFVIGSLDDVTAPQIRAWIAKGQELSP